jgi:hypothetical protein
MNNEQPIADLQACHPCERPPNKHSANVPYHHDASLSSALDQHIIMALAIRGEGQRMATGANVSRVELGIYTSVSVSSIS